MKKIVLSLLVVPLLALVLSGCATYMPAGALYVAAKGAVATTDDNLLYQNWQSHGHFDIRACGNR